MHTCRQALDTALCGTLQLLINLFKLFLQQPVLPCAVSIPNYLVTCIQAAISKDLFSELDDRNVLSK